MRIEVITLFPELFSSPLAAGLLGKAIEQGTTAVGFIDPRSFTHDRHRTVDDAPYGGGAGMVMKPEPIVAAIDAARSRSPGAHVVLLTPQGRPLRQADLRRLSAHSHLVLVAGRYEGFDERVRAFVDEELSLGDFVLTGGEYAALAVIDGVVRLLPGTLGNEASAHGDSFSEGLLEHAQYTRPPEFRGHEVPELLRSGDHAKVLELRHREALQRTRGRRPDLLAERGLDAHELALLAETESLLPPIAVITTLGDDPATWSSQMDAYAALVEAYDLARLVLIPPPSELEQVAHVLTAAIGESSSETPAAPARARRARRVAIEREAERARRRKESLERIRIGEGPAEALATLRSEWTTALVAGVDPVERDADLTPMLGPRALRDRLLGEGRPLVLLHAPGGPAPDVRLTPVRPTTGHRLRGAMADLAIRLDRLLGEA